MAILCLHFLLTTSSKKVQFHQWFKKASNIRSLILSVGNMKVWEPLYYTHGSKQNLKRFIILHETGFVIIQPFLLSSTCCWCEPVCSGSSAGGEQDLIQVLHKKPTVCLVISQSNMSNLSCTFINLSKMSQKNYHRMCFNPVKLSFWSIWNFQETYS